MNNKTKGETKHHRKWTKHFFYIYFDIRLYYYNIFFMHFLGYILRNLNSSAISLRTIAI